ncbi:glycosyltransferase family protein [Paludibacterium paludis]|uniref:Spore protein YkvP/CgeB glycosyl transferase-like domain-containing protein n=1 Tax=Paludibacterium paludis TaxID=1225769 RepID=A0A918P732_9NEIS|nr:glycosyltransferase [Paludibacterium paludis]GGY27962.1 hypothetical protein GCM10011289_34140 [Paludibacterium paludis]
MHLRRILLQIPVLSFFYLNQVFALRRAFLRKGVDCLIQTPGMPNDAENLFLKNFQPDVIFTINGACSDVTRGYRAARHIHWLQDNQFNGVDLRRYFESDTSDDIFYFVSERLAGVMRLGPNHLVGQLRFAAEPVDEAAREREVRSSFSLVGYIPNVSMRDTSFTLGNGRTFSGKDYFDFLAQVQGNSLDFPLELMDQLVETFFLTLGVEARGLPAENLSWFREEMIRGANRSRVVRALFERGYDCRLFGPEDWASWPEFASSYCGEAREADQTQSIYQTSALNIHNGGTVHHPRVLDCMASFGGPVLANRCEVRDQNACFEPGVHYLEFDLADLSDVAEFYLANPQAREAISRSAYDEIRARHTWDNRVDDILADLASL